LSALAAFAVPLVSALTLNAPTTTPTIGATVNLTWEATTSDPSSFNIYMANTIFHNTFAIATDVQTSAGEYTLVLPPVPVGDGYTLEATDISNINNVYATSGDFSVGAQTTASAPTLSTTSTSMTMSMPMSSGTGTASTATGTSPSGSSSASSTPSSISGAAASFKIGMGPAAVVLLSA
ncbi:hypothetical protein BDR07DRAFT_1238099, partial [Suillus spraguei]